MSDKIKRSAYKAKVDYSITFDAEFEKGKKLRTSINNYQRTLNNLKRNQTNLAKSKIELLNVNNIKDIRKEQAQLNRDKKVLADKNSTALKKRNAIKRINDRVFSLDERFKNVVAKDGILKVERITKSFVQKANRKQTLFGEMVLDKKQVDVLFVIGKMGGMENALIRYPHELELVLNAAGININDAIALWEGKAGDEVRARYARDKEIKAYSKGSLYGAPNTTPIKVNLKK